MVAAADSLNKRSNLHAAFFRVSAPFTWWSSATSFNWSNRCWRTQRSVSYIIIALWVPTDRRRARAAHTHTHDETAAAHLVRSDIGFFRDGQNPVDQVDAIHVL